MSYNPYSQPTENATTKEDTENFGMTIGGGITGQQKSEGSKS